MTSSGDIERSKKAVRADVLARRRAVHAVSGLGSGDRIAAADLSRLGALAGRPISAFHAFGDELPTLPLIERLIREGALIGLPVVIRKGLPLIFRRWRPGDAMGTGPFGIQQPLPEAREIEPEVLFVPMAAFDAAGYRLGYGGGFYDRTLERLRSRGSILAIGLAFDEQEVAAVPREPHDQRLDLMLTPSGLRAFRS